MDCIYATGLIPIRHYSFEAGLLCCDVPYRNVQRVIIGIYAMQGCVEGKLVYSGRDGHCEDFSRASRVSSPVVRARTSVIVYGSLLDEECRVTIGSGVLAGVAMGCLG